MIPFLSWEPDKGPYSASSTDVVLNVLPISNGYGPFASLEEVSDSLGAQCRGSVWYRNTAGSYGFIAGTATALKKLNADGTWTDVSRTVGGAYALADGHFWQFEVFGTNLYATHLNDDLQVFDIDAGANFAAASGSPPKAKFIRTVGDFLFLAHLKSGATTYPQRWQHSKINDPTNWTVDGSVGASDQQDIPDGGAIAGVLPMQGGARIIQERAKRLLTFTPGSAFAFTSSDIDADRGASSPYAIVPIGGGGYFYLNETGFHMNDAHVPIGAERVDDYFFASLNRSKLGEVQAVVDPYHKMVWVTFEDQGGARRMIGYNWQLDRWTQADAQPEFLVTAVTAGSTLNDLDSYGTLNDIPAPLDSNIFQGDYPSFGAFTSSDKLSLFAGPAAAATIETATTELTPEMRSFVTGAKIKGNASDYTMQVGAGALPDDALSWSSAVARSSRTGMVPFRSDGAYHRFRVTIAAGGSWTHAHGVTPFFQPSGQA